MLLAGEVWAPRGVSSLPACGIWHLGGAGLSEGHWCYPPPSPFLPRAGIWFCSAGAKLEGGEGEGHSILEV